MWRPMHSTGPSALGPHRSGDDLAAAPDELAHRRQAWQRMRALWITAGLCLVGALVSPWSWLELWMALSAGLSMAASPVVLLAARARERRELRAAAERRRLPPARALPPRG